MTKKLTSETVLEYTNSVQYKVKLVGHTEKPKQRKHKYKKYRK